MGVMVICAFFPDLSGRCRRAGIEATVHYRSVSVPGNRATAVTQ
jgi:hypothetical protein